MLKPTCTNPTPRFSPRPAQSGELNAYYQPEADGFDWSTPFHPIREHLGMPFAWPPEPKLSMSFSRPESEAMEALGSLIALHYQDSHDPSGHNQACLQRALQDPQAHSLLVGYLDQMAEWREVLRVRIPG